MYDYTCKYLAETYPTDYASWLLGKAIALTKLEPTELSTEPIRADSVILLQSSDTILHIEFQTRSDQEIPFRMADYRLRLHRKFPNKKVDQFVIYLKREDTSLVFQTEFRIDQLSHRFKVIRLWEEAIEDLQKYQGLLPLSILAKSEDRQKSLREIAQQIEKIEDSSLKRNIATATAVISGLVLEKEIIQRLLRSEMMKESVIYQEILQEGLAEGLVEGEARGKRIGKLEGLQEGAAEAKLLIAKNLLSFGISQEQVIAATGLTLDQIEKL